MLQLLWVTRVAAATMPVDLRDLTPVARSLMMQTGDPTDDATRYHPPTQAERRRRGRGLRSVADWARGVEMCCFDRMRCSAW